MMCLLRKCDIILETNMTEKIFSVGPFSSFMMHFVLVLIFHRVNGSSVTNAAVSG